MRLIDAARLELCSFMDESRIPRYAILSHTWGPDEITLQQFTDLSLRDDRHLKKSHGYRKIKKKHVNKPSSTGTNTYGWILAALYRLTTEDNALRKGWHMPRKMAAERT